VGVGWGGVKWTEVMSCREGKDNDKRTAMH
jgi:hypothetical protein